MSFSTNLMCVNSCPPVSNFFSKFFKEISWEQKLLSLRPKTFPGSRNFLLSNNFPRQRRSTNYAGALPVSCRRPIQTGSQPLRLQAGLRWRLYYWKLKHRASAVKLRNASDTTIHKLKLTLGTLRPFNRPFGPQPLNYVHKTDPNQINVIAHVQAWKIGRRSRGGHGWAGRRPLTATLSAKGSHRVAASYLLFDLMKVDLMC